MYTQPRMIYLVGQPGAGKSTLMANLTAPFNRVPVDGTPLGHGVSHDILVDKVTGMVMGAEIGKRRESFSGTDALASAVIDKAVPWIQTYPYPLLMAEGARLGNARFLTAALEAGYDVTLALLDHDKAEDWRLKRSRKLKRTQNESWVKGRLSASRNLAAAMTKLKGKYPIRIWTGHPDDLREGLWEIMTDG